MKIWIGICLIWLMGRVAVASDKAQELTYGVKAQVSFDAISRAAQAAQGLSASSEFRDKDQTANILKALSSYHSLEAFFRAPLPGSFLPVPKPKFELNHFENSVYVVLAQRALYPYVRVIYDLSGQFSREVKEKSRLMSRKERKLAQESCFSQADYSKVCIVRSSLEREIDSLVSSSLREHQIVAQEDIVKEAIMALMAQEGSSTVFHENNFYADATRHWLDRHSGEALLVDCLSQKASFTLERLASGNHCRRAFREEYFNKNNMSAALQFRVERELFGTYSDFKKLMTSLLEGPLPYGPLCFGSMAPNNCRYRKFKERLREKWSDFSRFNSYQQGKIVESLVYKLN